MGNAFKHLQQLVGSRIADLPRSLCELELDAAIMCEHLSSPYAPGWIGIAFQADAYVPIAGECRVEEDVPSRRPYAGPCLVGLGLG